MVSQIGEVLGVDLFALGPSGTSFVRVRVKLDVGKPLTRVVELHPEGSEHMIFQVLYEKLPNSVMCLASLVTECLSVEMVITILAQTSMVLGC
jgi:hypothetical protein